MTKILLLSHGNLCEEFMNTLQLIAGENQFISHIVMVEGQDMEKYSSEIESYIKKDDFPTLILTDLLGGSPFLTAANCYRKLQNRYTIELLSGLNLAMLLEVTMNNDDVPFPQLAQMAMVAARQGIIKFSETMKGG